MEITNLFNFNSSVNQVSREVIFFLQRINDALDVEFFDDATNELLYTDALKNYLDAPYDEDSYDDWKIVSVYFDGAKISLYIKK